MQKNTQPHRKSIKINAPYCVRVRAMSGEHFIWFGTSIRRLAHRMITKRLCAAHKYSKYSGCAPDKNHMRKRARVCADSFAYRVRPTVSTYIRTRMNNAHKRTHAHARSLASITIGTPKHTSTGPADGAARMCTYTQNSHAFPAHTFAISIYALTQTQTLYAHVCALPLRAMHCTFATTER